MRNIVNPVGTANIIQLKPIIDWTDSDVWDYIHKYNLSVNPEYKTQKRVGCIVCPKANFNSNYIGLMRYPKLVDCFIYAREKAKRNGTKIDWIITSDNKDYSNDKIYYICRWLNILLCRLRKTRKIIPEIQRKIRFNTQ